MTLALGSEISELRASLAAEVSQSQGDVEALRAVLSSTFETITLVRTGDAVHLLPVVHGHMLRFDPDGHPDYVEGEWEERPVQPKLQAVPGVQRSRSGTALQAGRRSATASSLARISSASWPRSSSCGSSESASIPKTRSNSSVVR